MNTHVSFKLAHFSRKSVTLLKFLLAPLLKLLFLLVTLLKQT
jgi:hypothetical protein